MNPLASPDFVALIRGALADLSTSGILADYLEERGDLRGVMLRRRWKRWDRYRRELEKSMEDERRDHLRWHVGHRDADARCFRADRDFHRYVRDRFPEVPRWTHDCDKCVYLGRFDWSRDLQFDLWFADHGGMSPGFDPAYCTVIARHGNDGPAYTSGIIGAERIPARAEALRRALDLGLIRRKVPPAVHHVNGDPADNRPENLRAVDPRENRR